MGDHLLRRQVLFQARRRAVLELHLQLQVQVLVAQAEAAAVLIQVPPEAQPTAAEQVAQVVLPVQMELRILAAAVVAVARDLPATAVTVALA